MNEATIRRLEKSFSLIAPRSGELVERFYAHLFSVHPQLRGMFPEEMRDQRMRLLSSIVRVVQSLRSLDTLKPALLEMGRRHAGYGVMAEHYPYVRDALVGVMRELAGPRWKDQYTADWLTALDVVADVMVQGHALAAPSLAY